MTPAHPGRINHYHGRSVIPISTHRHRHWQDGGGSLDRDEFDRGVRGLGTRLTPMELDEAMAEMDDDNSGEVDYEEFATCASYPPPPRTAGAKGRHKGLTGNTERGRVEGLVHCSYDDVVT